ncbi:hypothetical protein A3Q56_05167, partial [Intoshia linei]
MNSNNLQCQTFQKSFPKLDSSHFDNRDESLPILKSNQHYVTSLDFASVKPLENVKIIGQSIKLPQIDITIQEKNKELSTAIIAINKQDNEQISYQKKNEFLEELRLLSLKNKMNKSNVTKNLVMGGKPVYLSKRNDVMTEIAYLRSIILPRYAKDLYIGKGIKLPDQHQVNQIIDLKLPNSKHNELSATRQISTKLCSDRQLIDVRAKLIPICPKIKKTLSPRIIDMKNIRHLNASPNPLVGVPYKHLVKKNYLNKLINKFKMLDKDNDGNLKFKEIQKLLPLDLSKEKTKYIKDIYKLSSFTYFGLREFVPMLLLFKKIENL